MNALDSRLININEQSPQPDTDYKALSEALQRDVGEAASHVHCVYQNFLMWKRHGAFVSNTSIFELEQALHKLDASHLVTTHLGEPLPVVTEDCTYCGATLTDKSFMSDDKRYCSDLCFISESNTEIMNERLQEDADSDFCWMCDEDCTCDTSGGVQ